MLFSDRGGGRGPACVLERACFDLSNFCWKYVRSWPLSGRNLPHPVLYKADKAGCEELVVRNFGIM